MPPAPPDSPVGRASGPVGGARRNRTSRVSQVGGGPSPLSPQRSGRPAKGPTGASRSDALEALLVDLGSQIQSGSSLMARAAGAMARAAGAMPRAAGATASVTGAPSRAAEAVSEAADVADSGALRTDPARFHATGLAPLDRRLGGGFPAGRLSEICGAQALDTDPQSPGQSAGRTSLALGLLAETLARGVLAAWVDLADAFDPPSAAEAILARGGEVADLDQLLWVRARSESEAVRSCDRLLQTEGFELVVLDLFAPAGPTGGTRHTPIKDVTWLRLARLAAGTRTALVVLSREPLTGSRAELVLEMRAHRTRFAGPPSLLEAIETEAIVRRHRGRPTGERVALSVHVEGAPERGKRLPRRDFQAASRSDDLSSRPRG